MTPAGRAGQVRPLNVRSTEGLKSEPLQRNLTTFKRLLFLLIIFVEKVDWSARCETPVGRV
ncbi:hypothetical protein ABE41_012490 [Fictibacillus arsenicus]|uniref:Uncharacterized protein n=1 Tax=Fictibacillus arsenicus TaxID=255247 RepID=A0A1B1Z604_9BACL|nr:hypothetical protein ABE41_012490 [Fictibacillus arsenicus]